MSQNHTHSGRNLHGSHQGPALQSKPTWKELKHNIREIPPKTFYPNLSKTERQTLRSLASDHSLVIKSADKGSGIVVEDRAKYIMDGTDHLSDPTIYEKIDSDPTLPLAEAINGYVERMYDKGLI